MSENLFAYTATNSGYSEGTAGAINGETCCGCHCFVCCKK